MVRNDMSHA